MADQTKGRPNMVRPKTAVWSPFEHYKGDQTTKNIINITKSQSFGDIDSEFLFKYTVIKCDVYNIVYYIADIIYCTNHYVISSYVE